MSLWCRDDQCRDPDTTQTASTLQHRYKNTITHVNYTRHEISQQTSVRRNKCLYLYAANKLAEVFFINNWCKNTQPLKYDTEL